MALHHALDPEAVYTTDEVGPSRAIVRAPKLGGSAVVRGMLNAAATA